PNTTPTKKAIICLMKKSGHSHDEIHAALPGRSDISNHQINRIFKRYGEKENYYSVGHSSGHPHKLTPRDTRVGLRHLSNSNAHDASDLKRLYFPEVSVATVKHALRAEGLEPHIQRSVPFIS
ncbi:hypothetical protein EI94DRAFT_1482220, partial [Lactarius quietus]